MACYNTLQWLLQCILLAALFITVFLDEKWSQTYFIFLKNAKGLIYLKRKQMINFVSSLRDFTSQRKGKEVKRNFKLVVVVSDFIF